jgi:hypothetical protein
MANPNLKIKNKKDKRLIAKAEKPSEAWLKANGLVIMGVKDGKYILGDSPKFLQKGDPKYQ